MELEGVRKENQGKAPPCPGGISHLEAARDSTGFPGQEPPGSQTGKVGRDWHSRQDTDLSKGLMGTGKEMRKYGEMRLED